MRSSNYIVGICEINYKGNQFENNNFPKDLLVRDSEKSDKENEEINIIIDFSLILIAIFLGLSFVILLIKDILKLFFKKRKFCLKIWN